jgi:hypothetical protein
VLAADAWTGDLHQFRIQTWREHDTDVAAVVVARHGEAAVWINTAHVHALDERLVCHWARHAAHYRPPLDVIYAHELPSRLWDNYESAPS